MRKNKIKRNRLRVGFLITVGNTYSGANINYDLRNIFCRFINLGVCGYYLRQQKLRKSGILEVDKMTGKVFEEYLQGLLKRRGYKVSLTSVTGDYGAYLVLSNTYKKIVVQAKRYNKKVGLKAVQEIVSAKNHYNADECWVITNNYFTAPAVKLATSNKVILIDRDRLIKWMLEMNKVA